MANSTVRAALQDGPRAGEIVEIEAGPEGRPPHQVVVSDPPGLGGRAEESFDIEPEPTAATTYYLYQQDTQADSSSYIYQVGEPD
jgi:hypothetical protein